MLKAGWCVAFLVLVAPAVRAQVPALLPGLWEVYEIGFVPDATTPDSVRQRLDDPQVASLNTDILNREAHLVVEFRADGTYEFTITRGGWRLRTEAGTYALKDNQLLAESEAPDGSSLNNQYLARLTKRTLVFAFPVGSHLPGVREEVAYRRLK